MRRHLNPVTTDLEDGEKRPVAADVLDVRHDHVGPFVVRDFPEALVAPVKLTGGDLIDELHRIHVPVLVMVGLHDRNVGVDSNRESPIPCPTDGS